ncbi:uncharacterized protein [Myotis yumanensis]|uniref:uncharacterized protein n=1 Tax=Myotis yumanensis TaxID=159337 RepID=UPI0038D3B1BA
MGRMGGDVGEDSATGTPSIRVTTRKSRVPTRVQETQTRNRSPTLVRPMEPIISPNELELTTTATRGRHLRVAMEANLEIPTCSTHPESGPLNQVAVCPGPPCPPCTKCRPHRGSGPADRQGPEGCSERTCQTQISQSANPRGSTEVVVPAPTSPLLPEAHQSMLTAPRPDEQKAKENQDPEDMQADPLMATNTPKGRRRRPQVTQGVYSRELTRTLPSPWQARF